MGKPTKGPWKSQHDAYATWVDDQRWISVTAPKRGEIGRFKREPDAVLAASATELLGALVALVECEQTTPELWEAARAAIAKATA